MNQFNNNHLTYQFSETRKLIIQPKQIQMTKTRIILDMIIVSFVSFAIQLSRSFSTSHLFFRGFEIGNFSQNETNEIIQFIIRCLLTPFISIIIQWFCGTYSDYYDFSIGKRKFFITFGKYIWLIGRFITFCVSIYPVYVIHNETKNNDSIEIDDNNNNKQLYLTQDNSIYVVFEVIYSLGYILYVIGENMIEVSQRSYIIEAYENEYQNSVWILTVIMSMLGHIVYSILYISITGSLRGLDERHNQGVLSMSIVGCEIVPLLFLPIIILIYEKCIKEQWIIRNEVTSNKIDGYWNSIRSSSVAFNKYVILILFFLFIGSFIVDGYDGRKIVLYFDYLFEVCDQTESIFVHNIHDIIAFVLTCCISIFLLFFNKHMHILTIIMFLLSSFASGTFYDTENFNEISSSSESEMKNDQLSNCFISESALYHFKAFVPYFFGILLSTFVRSYPYALLHDFIVSNRVGFTVSLTNCVVQLGQLFSALFCFLLTSLNPEVFETSGKDELIVITHFMWSLTPSCFIGFIISFVLIYLFQSRNKQKKQSSYNDLSSSHITTNEKQHQKKQKHIFKEKDEEMKMNQVLRQVKDYQEISEDFDYDYSSQSTSTSVLFYSTK